MGRMYSIPLTNPGGTSGSPYSAIVDAFEIVAATGKPFWLHEIVIGQVSDYGDAQAEGLPFIIKRGVGNTAGSGGTSVTPAKHMTGDGAAGATAKICNTVRGTSRPGSSIYRPRRPGTCSCRPSRASCRSAPRRTRLA